MNCLKKKSYYFDLSVPGYIWNEINREGDSAIRINPCKPSAHTSGYENEPVESAGRNHYLFSLTSPRVRPPSDAR